MQILFLSEEGKKLISTLFSEEDKKPTRRANKILYKHSWVHLKREWKWQRVMEHERPISEFPRK